MAFAPLGSRKRCGRRRYCTPEVAPETPGPGRGFARAHGAAFATRPPAAERHGGTAAGERPASEGPGSQRRLAAASDARHHPAARPAPQLAGHRGALCTPSLSRRALEVMENCLEMNGRGMCWTKKCAFSLGLRVMKGDSHRRKGGLPGLASKISATEAVWYRRCFAPLAWIVV